ncbi:phosphatase PAP2 family protein [Solitalea koreensis]|uniref:PAP2 superfamily protein n=1 Tax=Solitalea koreensis TaxID=543615 RepID=A0A521DIY0_9SPHI|nr:phosphatase PAP2 family protein [Solitalea koreensis]SMO71667.1 PAP2 superfamily protein [Solitalea koreensis]
MRFVKYGMLFLGMVQLNNATAQYCSFAKDTLITKHAVPSASLNTNTNTPLKVKLKEVFIPITFITYGGVALNNNELQQFNIHIRDQIVENHPQFSTKIDNYLQYVPSVAALGLKVGGVQGRNSMKRSAFIYGVSAGIMALAVRTLKSTTHVQRPDSSNYESFPSGHTATAFMGAEFLHQEYKSVSPWIGISGYAVAAATGAFRMYNNKHWFSDVVAGAGVGMLSTKIAYWIFPDKAESVHKSETAYSLLTPFFYDGSVGINWEYDFK